VLDRPRLRRDLSVASVGADKLFVSAGGRHSVIEDAAAVQLAPLLVHTPDVIRTVAVTMDSSVLTQPGTYQAAITISTEITIKYQ